MREHLSDLESRLLAAFWTAGKRFWVETAVEENKECLGEANIQVKSDFNFNPDNLFNSKATYYFVIFVLKFLLSYILDTVLIVLFTTKAEKQKFQCVL